MSSKRWACSACTFLNDWSNEKCEMCSSGDRPDESAALTEGAEWACSTCTAENAWATLRCEMCGTGTREAGKPVGEAGSGAAAASASKGRKGGKGKAGGKAGGKEGRDKADGDFVTVFQAPSVGRSLWKNGLPLADVILEAVDEEGAVTEVPAHRCFLAAVSDEFKRMLFGEGAPEKPEDGPARLRLDKVDVPALKECVRWCYVETWCEDAAMAVRCKRTAKRFDVPGLEQACCEAVRTKLGVGAALDTLDKAARAWDQELVDAALAGACRDPDAAVVSRAFLHLCPRAMEALVGAQGFGADEASIFEAVVTWADTRAAQRGGATRKGGGAAAAAASGAGGGGGAYAGPQCTAEELLKELCPDATEEAAASSSAAAPSKPAAAAAAAFGDSTATTAGAAGESAAASGGETTAYEAESGWSSTAGAAPAPALRRVDILHKLRLPLLEPAALVSLVRPTGVVAAADFTTLIASSYRPKEERRALKEVAGFPAQRRQGATRTLLVHMWGGGGACGEASGPQYGGAGGYLCASFEASPDDKLTVYVGGGGAADASGSNEALSTKAWPNGGCGGHNYVSGGGGAATFITSELKGGEVVAGAGGGGGGPANGSWSSGGGGGGGTCDGKIGEGGHGGNQSRKSPTPESDGGGKGGMPDTGGSKAKGADSHGAGGGPGGTARANGGDGGASSCMHATEVSCVAATDHVAVESPLLPGRSAGGGGKPSAPKDKGEAGLCIIQVKETGEIFEFVFTGEPQPFVFKW